MIPDFNFALREKRAISGYTSGLCLNILPRGTLIAFFEHFSVVVRGGERDVVQLLSFQAGKHHHRKGVQEGLRLRR